MGFKSHETDTKTETPRAKGFFVSQRDKESKNDRREIGRRGREEMDEMDQGRREERQAWWEKTEAECKGIEKELKEGVNSGKSVGKSKIY